MYADKKDSQRYSFQSKNTEKLHVCSNPFLLKRHTFVYVCKNAIISYEKCLKETQGGSLYKGL